MMREFTSGATRNSDDTKIDYEGFLSFLALEAFGQYMTEHRIQADGRLRDSDNWQKGIPITEYNKSEWRHRIATGKIMRGFKAYSPETGKEITLKESLCAEFFNIQGMLHEVVKSELEDQK